MPEQLWFTEILNHLFAGPVTGLLRMLHIEPKFPQAPITNALAMELLVFIFLVLMFAILRTRLSVDKPGALQHIFEGAHGFIEGQSEEIVGHHSEGFTPFLMTLAFFILYLQPDRDDSGIRVADGFPVVPLGSALRLCLLPDARLQTCRDWLPEALCRAHADSGASDDSH